MWTQHTHATLAPTCGPCRVRAAGLLLGRDHSACVGALVELVQAQAALPLELKEPFLPQEPLSGQHALSGQRAAPRADDVSAPPGPEARALAVSARSAGVATCASAREDGVCASEGREGSGWSGGGDAGAPTALCVASALLEAAALQAKLKAQLVVRS